jgi:hypothetical protein
MFADIEADIYVMADGDLTYDPAAAQAMVDLLLTEQFDMVVGARQHDAKDAYRGGHVLGNRLFTALLSSLFARSFTDVFLGLPGVLAPLREELPGALRRLRDRDGDEHPRARTADAGGRGPDGYGARPEGPHPSFPPFATDGASSRSC